MADQGRARPSGQALVSDGAQEVSTLTGFDPSREQASIGQATRHLERVQWKDMAKREVEIPLRGCINLNEYPVERSA